MDILVAPSEFQIQKAVVQWAAWNEQTHTELKLLYAVPNGAYVGPRHASKLKAEGLKNGVPDLVLPCARHGFHGLYLETKKPKGKISKEQSEFHALLEWQNYKVVVYRSVDEGINTLKWWLE